MIVMVDNQFEGLSLDDLRRLKYEIEEAVENKLKEERVTIYYVGSDKYFLKAFKEDELEEAKLFLIETLKSKTANQLTYERFGITPHKVIKSEVEEYLL